MRRLEERTESEGTSNFHSFCPLGLPRHTHRPGLAAIDTPCNVLLLRQKLRHRRSMCPSVCCMKCGQCTVAFRHLHDTAELPLFVSCNSAPSWHTNIIAAGRLLACLRLRSSSMSKMRTRHCSDSHSAGSPADRQAIAHSDGKRHGLLPHMHGERLRQVRRARGTYRVQIV